MASHSNKRWWEEKPITLCALELHFQVMSQERFPFGLSFRRWRTPAAVSVKPHSSFPVVLVGLPGELRQHVLVVTAMGED